jgi:hypothetical protein
LLCHEYSKSSRQNGFVLKTASALGEPGILREKRRKPGGLARPEESMSDCPNIRARGAPKGKTVFEAGRKVVD